MSDDAVPDDARALRILIAEDMQMLRGALVALLGMEPDLEVVAQVETGDQVVPMAMKVQPDVAIIDVDLPNLDGLSAADALHRAVPGCRTLILTGMGRPGTLRRALSVSVSGFLLKDVPPERLTQAIRDVAAGKRVMDAHLAMSAWDVGEIPLSDRELEALRLAAQGAEPGEIAATMHVSIGTVRNYLTKIVTKLNARNRVDAIRIAIEAGWL